MWGEYQMSTNQYIQKLQECVFTNKKLSIFFCELLEWAVQQIHLVMTGAVSWTEREKILLEREVLSLLNGNRVGEFVKDVENVSSEGLICYYKSLHEKSVVQHLRIYRSEV